MQLHLLPRPTASPIAMEPHELVVDNFSGGGGVSEGIEESIGRPPDIAINHDRDALAMHARNHPYTRHLCEDVWHVNPVEVCRGLPVALVWFSPDCTHFSRAKGGRPRSAKIRGLAWVAVRWARAVRPRVIVLENVEEFLTWGPLGRDGRPCPERRVHALGEPLRTVTSSSRSPFALVAPSLVQTSYGERQGQAPRCLDLHRPLGTVVAGGQKHALVSAFLAKHYGGNESPGSSLAEPVSTVTARDHHALVTSHVLKLHGSARDGRASDLPLPTVRAQGTHLGEVRALLLKYYGQGTGQDLREPLHTVPARDRFAVVTVAGEQHAIADIGMRMLQPRELYRAQGFRDDYVIDVGADGRPLTKTAQVRMCGNSVPPPMAAAVVRANLAEDVTA